MSNLKTFLKHRRSSGSCVLSMFRYRECVVDRTLEKNETNSNANFRSKFKDTEFRKKSYQGHKVIRFNRDSKNVQYSRVLYIEFIQFARKARSQREKSVDRI